MPGYSHLLDEERDQIAALKAAGRSIGAIAKAVGRAKSHRVAGVAPESLVRAIAGREQDKKTPATRHGFLRCAGPEG